MGGRDHAVMWVTQTSTPSGWQVLPRVTRGRCPSLHPHGDQPVGMGSQGIGEPGAP